MITIALDGAPTDLSTLLKQVEDSGEVVLFCRGEEPVAEIRPTTARGKPSAARSQASGAPELGVSRLPMHPELSRVKFHEDPVAPLEAEDWPDD